MRETNCVHLNVCKRLYVVFESCVMQFFAVPFVFDSCICVLISMIHEYNESRWYIVLIPSLYGSPIVLTFHPTTYKLNELHYTSLNEMEHK